MTIAGSACVHPSCVLEDNVHIGGGSSIGPHSVVGRGAVIGEGVRIGSHVHLRKGICIEDDARIGDGVHFALESHDGESPTTGDAGQRGILIGRGAVIGTGATLLAGVTVASRAVVRPGSVVTQNVPTTAIVEGHPSQIVGYLDALRTVVPVHSGTEVPQVHVQGVKLRELRDILDMRGNLCALEYGRELPFIPQRTFFVYNVPNARVRGAHAHKACHQFLICPYGSVSILVDDGEHRQEILLDRPSLGLHVQPGVWAVQYRYSQDAILLVLASDPYDPEDYIRDYDQFLVWVSHRSVQ